MRLLAASISVACLVACTGGVPSVQRPSGPFGGDVRGSSFATAAERADWTTSGTYLNLTLSTFANDCGSPPPSPQVGWMEVTVGIPRAQAVPGTYSIPRPALGVDQITLAVTRYTSGTFGNVSQDTILLGSGTLVIEQIAAARLSGWPVVDENGVRLSGLFDAAICGP